MTKRVDIDTVIRANEELLAVLAKVETSLAKAKEGFSSISLVQNEAAKTSNELGMQLADTGEIAEANAEKSQSAVEKSVWAFETLNAAYAKYEATLTEANIADKFREDSLKSLGAVHSSVFQAMEGQLMRFVETGRFSAAAFAKVVAQQVKTELVGLAAKSAVWAIYEVAMGLKDLATPGMQWAATLHFASAKQFALVGGAALAAAAGVQSLSGGTQERKSSGTNTMALKTTGALPMSLDSNSQVKTTQQVTINIYNPLSDQNWAKIAEDNIIPAINDAANRNINIMVKNL